MGIIFARDILAVDTGSALPTILHHQTTSNEPCSGGIGFSAVKAALALVEKLGMLLKPLGVLSPGVSTGRLLAIF